MLKFKYNIPKTSLLIILIIIFLGSIFLSPLIKQEGNLIKPAIAVVKLQTNLFSKFSNNPEKYLIKPQNLNSALLELANEKQIKFIDQMGAGLFFKDKNEQTIFAKSRMFTRYYTVIEF